MKACWIGILVTSALVISAFGQNSVALHVPAINSVLATVTPDKSSLAAILEAEAGHKMLTDQPQKETEPASEVQVSGDTLVVSPPDSSPDVPTAIVRYLDLTPLQIAAIQGQIAIQRGQVQSLMEQDRKSVV